MFIGIDRNEVIKYVSVLEPDKENPTEFDLGIISGRERLILVAKFETKEDPAIFYDVVKKGLKAIKGLKNKAGEVRNFNVITDEVMDELPTALVKELFHKLVGMNFLNEAERKN